MFLHQYRPSAQPDAHDFIIRICQQSALLVLHDNHPDLPRRSDLDVSVPLRSFYLGLWNQQPCWAEEYAEAKAPDSMAQWFVIREVLTDLTAELFHVTITAKHLLSWHAGQQFCGTCGHALQDSPTERARVCTHCARVHYPIIAPAIIVAIRRGEEILLAHNHSFHNKIHSIIAGFIEAGETPEQAVAREVREEVGIEVRDIRYLESQAWPFPNSLMLGFSADYAQGNIQADGMEIEHAAWYSKNKLPQLPRPGSISFRLICRTMGFPCGD